MHKEASWHLDKGATPYITANEAYSHALHMETPLQAAFANIDFSGEYVLQVGFSQVALHEGLLIEEIYLSLNGELPTLNDQVICGAFASIFAPFPGVVCTQERVCYLPVNSPAHGYRDLSSLGGFKVRTTSSGTSTSAVVGEFLAVTKVAMVIPTETGNLGKTTLGRGEEGRWRE
jgi:hypothetical protein